MDIVGTWKLISWENRDRSGARTFPMGEDAVGYIGYAADGCMFVQIMASERANFAVPDVLGGTLAEKAAALETVIAYCGSYTLGEETIVHHVAVSSFPNWVGVDQERFMKLDGDSLELSTGELLLEGERRTAHLIWERVQGGE